MFNQIEGWLSVEPHICKPPTSITPTEDNTFEPQLESVWRCHCGTLWEVTYRSKFEGVIKIGYERVHLPQIIIEYHDGEGVQNVW